MCGKVAGLKSLVAFDLTRWVGCGKELCYFAWSYCKVSPAVLSAGGKDFAPSIWLENHAHLGLLPHRLVMGKSGHVCGSVFPPIFNSTYLVFGVRGTVNQF